MQIVRIFLLAFLILTANASFAQTDASKPPVWVTVSKPTLDPILPDPLGYPPQYPESWLDYDLSFPGVPPTTPISTQLYLVVYGYTDKDGNYVPCNPTLLIAVGPPTAGTANQTGLKETVSPFDTMAKAGYNIPAGATVDYAYTVTVTVGAFTDSKGHQQPSSSASNTSDKQSANRPDNYTPLPHNGITVSPFDPNDPTILDDSPFGIGIISDDPFNDGLLVGVPGAYL